MIISYAFLQSILKESCPSSEDLEFKLTQIGFEVDAVDKPVQQNARVVEVLSIEPFEMESKTLYSVKIGWGSEERHVVTSWSSLKTGDKVVYAEPESIIDGQTILSKAFADKVSQGMLLSSKELKLNNDWVNADEKQGLLVLPEDTPTGEDFYKLFFLDQPFYHLKIPYNRPDCLSFYGLLREIVTAYKLSIPVQTRKDIRNLLPSFNERQLHRTVQHDTFKGIDLLDTERCPFYAGTIIENAQIKPSCYEIRKRLFAFQAKPVSNAVDVVNLLMLYFGHPLHTFDLDKLAGKHIVVRQAKKGETIETLDERTVTLDEEDLVIADDIQPVAIAGVIGSKESEVNNETKNIFIESAYFSPIAISHTSEKHNYQTDASGRFSRGANILQVKEMMNYASHLLSVLCGGTIAGEHYQEGQCEYHAPTIQYQLSDFTRTTGLDITKFSATQILQCLEIPFEIKLHDQLMIKVPSFRTTDLKESVDITEDLLRFIGYDKIVPKKPCFTINHTLENPRIKTEQWLRPVLMGMGFYEVITDSFVPDDVVSLCFDLEDETLVKVANPLSSGWQFLTPDKALTMLRVLKNNYSRKIIDLQLFEIGKHYLRQSEDWYLNLIITGNREKDYWKKTDYAMDYHFIKGALESLFDRLGIVTHQKKSLEQHVFDPQQRVDYYVDNHLAASAGMLKKSLCQHFDIDRPIYFAKCKLSLLIKHFNKDRRYQPISYLHEITRDIAFFVPMEMKSGDMIHAIHHVGGSSLKKVDIFDLYEDQHASAPKDHKSIAFRLHFIFRDNVSKEKVQEVVNVIIDKLTLNFNAVLRK